MDEPSVWVGACASVSMHMCVNPCTWAECAHVCTVSTRAPGRRRQLHMSAPWSEGLESPSGLSAVLHKERPRETGCLPCKTKTSRCPAWPARLFPQAEALHGETSADLSVDRERGFFPVPLKWGLLEAQPGHPFCAHFSGSGRM